MEKLTLNQLSKKNDWKEAVVVFTEDSFNRKYPEITRSYEVTSDNKYFDANMNGNSLYGDCLDGTDDDVRLDWYTKEWKVEYCYITK